MKSSIFAAALILALGFGPAKATVALQVSPRVTNEINVTPDSSRGWLPTAEQRKLALTTVELFLDALEAGRYEAAYELQADINKRGQPLAQFVEAAQKFSALAGPVKFWKVLNIAWTKDPAQAPLPGIYVAIDLAGQFSNVDRDCGYMVLYQPASAGRFTVMRRENNYLDNATARRIEEQGSKSAVTALWSQLSRNCPNYTLQDPQ